MVRIQDVKSVFNQDLYLLGASSPDFLTKGLYAGLKARNGIPTPLPLVLEEGDEYVNAGFLDGMPCSLIREAEIQTLNLHVTHNGSLRASVYLMLQSGEVYHCLDHLCEGEEALESTLKIPSTVLDDPNGHIIYFRIQSVSGKATLHDWFFTAPTIKGEAETTPLTMISRSLGDSPILIKRYYKLLNEYSELKKRHPHIRFFPAPQLEIYESDPEALRISASLLISEHRDSIKLYANPYNLGGGGNMCLAVYESVIRRQEKNQFAMLDSDTILPFRTFYFASIKAALLHLNSFSQVRVPVVMYASKPNQVLESGSLFGRGNWGIISETPSQPCIMALHHGERLEEKSTHAALAGITHTDYPPFIFSIFSATKHQLATHFLPTPFFLRGDDIEMGQHLRSAGIPCEVDGSLVVFQEPKHSLWHEWMAILHGTCLVLSAAANENRCENGFPELERYFRARLNSHALIHDLNGLTTYECVLDRLMDLTQWPVEEIVTRFHDPEHYLSRRDLNRGFTPANFKMVEALMQGSAKLSAKEFIQIPFLYFEKEYFSLVQPESPPPNKIAMINSSQKTAAILEPIAIDPATMKETRDRIIEKATALFSGDCSDLANRCLKLTDRKEIISQYLSRYPLDS